MIGLRATFESIRDSKGPLCVGLDPSREALLEWGLDDSADGALEFAQVVLNAAASRVGIVKPQVAFFERFGSPGFLVLERVIAEATSLGLSVIADCKRGDIGTSMEGYARAWLDDGPLASHAMTVSPYQGFEALEPAFAAAETNGSVVFVLCATSNRDAADIQSARAGELSLPARISSFVRDRNRRASVAGLVIGATRTLTESGLTETDLEGTLILAPGFGAQGASLRDVNRLYGRNSPRVIPAVSRAVTQRGPGAVAHTIDALNAELGG